MKKIYSSLILLTFVFVGTIQSYAQTTVPAVIPSSQVWTTSGSPYIITQNTFIGPGISVKVMPGVEVQSTNYSNELLIDGEFQAIGTEDSMILFDSLTINYSNKADEYDPPTGAGAYLRYCHFNGPGYSSRTVYVQRINARVEDCRFTNFFYGIMSYGTLDVLNCTFDGNAGQGYALNLGNSSDTTRVIGCTFNKSYGIWGMGKIIMRDNKVNGAERIYISSYLGVDWECNDFRNIKFGITINAYHYGDTNYIISLKHNTFDSIGNTNDAMLRINRNERIYVNNNNFLHVTGSQTKLLLEGSNSNPATFTTKDFRNNYWGTTDSATIAGYIRDYNDDITIYGKADFSGYLSAEDTSCSIPPSSCNASFYVALDTSFSNQLFLINNSTGVKSTTQFNWTFGDGTSSSLRKPTHTYKKFGKYEICLTLTDSANNCSSTFCDSLGLDSSGNLLKKEGFTINVLDESDVTGVQEHDQLTGMKLYPNPGNGNFTIAIPAFTSDGDIQVQVMDLPGRMILQKELRPLGNNEWALDLTDLQEGLYLLHMKVGKSEITAKVIINR